MTVRQFFTWWIEQLVSLLPTGLWHTTGSNRHVTFLIDQGDAKIRAQGIGSEGAIGLEQAQLTGLLEKVDAVSAEVGPKDYLVRDLTLPKLALSNLAESVGYQIPKLLPFSRDQVLFACGISDRPASDGQVSVWLAAIPRQRLAAHLDAFDIGLPDNPIDLRGPPAAGQPLSFSWRLAKQGSHKRGVRRLLWLGLAATWIIAIGLLSFTQQQQHDALLETYDALREQALKVSQLRERLDITQAQFGAVIERRIQTVSTLQLLNELTETLDDQTWLTNFELQGEKLSLQGVSASPAALIETLDASPLLSDVQFEAAITRDRRGTGSRFNISARTTAPGNGASQ